MRERGGKATLGELIGSASINSMGLKDLDAILGEKKPDMPPNAVGRFRLLRSLQQRFGNGYKNIPGVSNIIKEFDDEIEFQKTIGKMKKIGPVKGD